MILAAGHVYAWRRLVRDTRLTGRARIWAAGWLLAACMLLVPLWLLSRELPREYLGAPTTLAFTWKGVLFYIVLLLLLWDVLLLLGWCAGRLARALRPREKVAAGPGASPAPPGEGGPAHDRRMFLRRAAAATSVAGSVGICAAGVRSVLGDLETPEIPVRLPGLPSELDGYRIAVISDLHLGPVIGQEFLRGVVERANALHPDAVAVVGDVVDGPVGLLEQDVAPLAGLLSRDGTFFVTGNHEFYSGVRPWITHVRSLGLHVLDNKRVTLGDRHPGGRTFDLAGVHDYRAQGRYAPDLSAALEGRDPERGCVLLAHQPRHVFEASEAGVGLQISGHTHGGQIWPFGLLTALSQPYLKGLHAHTPSTSIYVTRGAGFWGPPMRVLSPPEVALVVLTA